MPRRIAYVEDKPAIRDNYANRLREEGFEVTAYTNKAEAIAGISSIPPDLALLDVSHAGDREAGYEICSHLRQISRELPIIFLTHRSSDIDKISGLRLGADDYISKADSIEYLLVRIEALFRRIDALRSACAPPAAAKTDGASGGSSGIDLDDTHSLVHWNGTRIDLPLTQYWIVRELCNHPGQVRSHRELMKACNLVVEANTITAHIKAIRGHFRGADPDFQCIRTERGRGYRWVPQGRTGE
jgi:two-component system OmpR family response regulator